MKTQRLLGVTSIAGTVTAVAGNGTKGFSGDKRLATAAGLNWPTNVAVDSAGNFYFSDTNNNRIRMVNISTGIIITVAGISTRGYSGDNGLATLAALGNPTGVAVDAKGNIYIADSDNRIIRMVDKSTGIITRVAGIAGSTGYSGDGGPATSAKLGYPAGVAVDLQGNVYIADPINQIIQMVSSSTGIITTVAGIPLSSGYYGDGGPATLARLYFARGVAVDAVGNIYIADSASNLIRMVDKSTGIITRVAGKPYDNYGYTGDGGLATLAKLNYPYGVAVDLQGNIYIADTLNNVIRMITSSTGIITTIASGIGANGVAVNIKGHVYITDRNNNFIYMIALTGPPSAATPTPTSMPSFKPTSVPTFTTTSTPTSTPTVTPTSVPTSMPTFKPTTTPTLTPTSVPAYVPTFKPTYTPTFKPVYTPTSIPQLVFVTSAATPKTTPNLLAYLFISPFICLMGQLFLYSSW